MSHRILKGLMLRIAPPPGKSIHMTVDKHSGPMLELLGMHSFSS